MYNQFIKFYNYYFKKYFEMISILLIMCFFNSIKIHIFLLVSY